MRVFPCAQSTLREASVAKFDRICQKLALESNDRVLEIGTGWGGFALHAAREYGCRVTTTTISRKQYEYSRQQVAAAGLSDRVTVLCEDYRALTGSFDKLVSIEMIEAVGHQYFDAYFRACSERLKPHGMMLLQAIVIPEQRYDRYRRSVDFIQRYIFPGGCLPSLGAICRSIGRATELQVSHLEDITAHYAETLRSGGGDSSAEAWIRCGDWGSPRSSSAPGRSTSATARVAFANGPSATCRSR